MQKAIIAPLPKQGRYLYFRLLPDTPVADALASLADIVPEDDVIGLGPVLTREYPPLAELHRPFPTLVGKGVSAPSSQHDLWIWLRGDDRGELVLRGRVYAEVLCECFALDQQLDGFMYKDGHDLTGYEDGTENPVDQAAVDAAFSAGMDSAIDGGSFVAVQKWVHDLSYFKSHSQPEQDHMIGRRLSDNEELDDAPESAHVKRTAQESFEPEAFVVRRSMPWADDEGEGLNFVAFGATLDPFEMQLKRMLGLDDGIVDALFRFSLPVSGSYFWCPPIASDGKLVLANLF